jgi:3-deoxy-D-manno-octulosonic-acid transferase
LISRLLYTLLAYMAALAVSIVMLGRGVRDRSYWRNFGERFGFGPTIGTSNIWVHAVSVGEVQAAAPFVRALRGRYPAIPVVFSTTTPTGAERARALFGSEAVVRYLPFDLPGPVRRFFERARPRLAVIFETELWPNIYHECAQRGIPLAIASARLSEKSVRRYRHFSALLKPMLERARCIATQTQLDADRFLLLGADPRRTLVMGNIKFDLALPQNLYDKGRALRNLYAPGRPLWVAGSTHEGEEEAMLNAHRHVRRAHPNALLAIAPRHPPRFASVAAELQRAGVSFLTRSSGKSTEAATEVLLIDTLGELLDFYAAGDVAFVGGSLVPIGGHNLLEPAALGRPVLTGPHYSNSREIAELLIKREALQTVSTPDMLGARVAELLADESRRWGMGGNGRAVVEENRGALEKLMKLVGPLIEAN